MKKSIHIVCLDAPSPPDYGGAIDMYYRIKALAEIGNKIILHYFNYNKSRNAAGVEEFCSEVHTYKRKNFLQSLSLHTPFIVASRINHDLIQRLNKDDYPILLEGIHCSGIIPFILNKKRVIIRVHNDEAAYYKHLAHNESSIAERFYFSFESRLLHQYQAKMNPTITLACLSQQDANSFLQSYHFENVHFIPCFIPWQIISSKTGKGKYCLYHGNMSISENEEAALWLVKNVFAHINVTLVIAGKGVSEKVLAQTKELENISVIPDPEMDHLDQLIQDAHINVIPSMNRTGVKLKLLNALYNGRFCISNTAGVEGSGITAGVQIANEPDEYINIIERLMQEDFQKHYVDERQQVLPLYDNQKNAAQLNALW